LERAVGSVNPDGMTAMDEGIQLAVQLVLESPDGTDRDVVLLTDGLPDEGRRDSTCEAARKAASHGVNLSTVGISRSVDEVDLEFLRLLTPTTLIIDNEKDIGGAMNILLGLDPNGSADPPKHGLTEINTHGLMEK
jgi:hypothetical protein